MSTTGKNNRCLMRIIFEEWIVARDEVLGSTSIDDGRCDNVVTNGLLR